MMNKPYMTISHASQETGLSQYFLRSGCKDGSVPCIKSGTKYLVNVPLLLRQLEAAELEAAENDV